MRARRAASIGSLPCRAAPLRCSPMPTSSLSRAAHCSLPHAPLFFLPSLFFFLLYSKLEQSHGWPPSLRPIRRLHDLPVQTLAPKPPPPPPPASPNPSRTPSRPNRRESKLQTTMNSSSAPHRRSPTSGPSPSNLGIEIDSPRLTDACALLVLTRSHCFRARSRAMPLPACCCSPQATRTRLCAAPPSAPTPPSLAESSHGRPVASHSPEHRHTPSPTAAVHCSRGQHASGRPPPR